MEKEELLSAWLKAKKAEENAKKTRNEVEEKIAALYGTSFDGGSKTFKEDDFKVVIKKNVVYSLDQDAWKTARQSLLDNERPEKIKFELDKTGYEWLRDNNPAQFKIVSDCVTVKENKPTISVEKL